MLHETALVLQREFDLSFAQARRVETPDLQNLLAVGVGGDPYAIRVDEIGGLFVDRQVVPIPTPVIELLGVAGFRGQVAPVYDLAALLGYPRRTAPRWLVLVRFSQPVALAFDAFDAHLAVTPERIVSLAANAPEGESPGRQTSRAHIFDAVHADDAVRPIIQLQSVIEEVQQRVDTARSTKER